MFPGLAHRRGFKNGFLGLRFQHTKVRSGNLGTLSNSLRKFICVYVTDIGTAKHFIIKSI